MFKEIFSSRKVGYQLPGYCPNQILEIQKNRLGVSSLNSQAAWHCHDFWTLCLISDRVELSFISLHKWKRTSDLNIRRHVSLICQRAKLGPNCKSVCRPSRDSIQGKAAAFPTAFVLCWRWLRLYSLSTKANASYIWHLKEIIGQLSTSMLPPGYTTNHLRLVSH